MKTKETIKAGGERSPIVQLYKTSHDIIQPHASSTAITDDDEADDLAWEAFFNEKKDFFNALAKEASEERQKGRTVPLDAICKEL